MTTSIQLPPPIVAWDQPLGRLISAHQQSKDKVVLTMPVRRSLNYDTLRHVRRGFGTPDRTRHHLRHQRRPATVKLICQPREARNNFRYVPFVVSPLPKIDGSRLVRERPPSNQPHRKAASESSPAGNTSWRVPAGPLFDSIPFRMLPFSAPCDSSN